MSGSDIGLLLPELILAATGFLVVFVDAFRRELNASRNILPGIAGLGALAALGASLVFLDRNEDVAGLIAIDNYTAFFRVLFCAVVFVVILGSYEFVTKNIRHAVAAGPAALGRPQARPADRTASP